MIGIEERRRPWRFLGDSISMNRRVVLAAYFAFAAARLSAVAAATPPAAVALTPQDNADLQRIAAYLDSIRTMYAKFRQVASGGAVGTGQLWMARPGRMRFEYDPPSPILLLADMFYVYYVDKELSQMSKVVYNPRCQQLTERHAAQTRVFTGEIELRLSELPGLELLEVRSAQARELGEE